jgi:Activator of Hsp90 ATPase homolog 1-like protein
MFMKATLEAEDGETKVTILFENIPPGIRPQDNEEGAQSSLEKLARYIEEGVN